jgi:hypothetical protein
MRESSKWHRQVVLAAVLLAGFGAAHLIDGFRYGVPADFGPSSPTARVLAVVSYKAWQSLRPDPV